MTWEEMKKLVLDAKSVIPRQDLIVKVGAEQDDGVVDYDIVFENKQRKKSEPLTIATVYTNLDDAKPLAVLFANAPTLVTSLIETVEKFKLKNEILENRIAFLDMLISDLYRQSPDSELKTRLTPVLSVINNNNTQYVSRYKVAEQPDSEPILGFTPDDTPTDVEDE